MSLRDWWTAVKDLVKPDKPESEPKRNNGYEPPEPTKEFIPPHSGEPPPWPPRDKR